MSNKFWTTLACVSFVVMSCGKIEEPKFLRMENFQIVKAGLTNTTISFDTRYNNPNEFGVSVKEADVDLYIDTTYLGKFVQEGISEVNKNADFVITLQGSIPIKAALNSNLPSLIGKDVLFVAKGSVKVGKGGVFINKKVSYSGKHKLDLNLIKNPAADGF
ncbi:MAG TPA: LEA type 2 family protein [Chitinophagaceae bacterium]|nr:LEA type 2 family protein [Chitinophagaceae bacterium]